LANALYDLIVKELNNIKSAIEPIPDLSQIKGKYLDAILQDPQTRIKFYTIFPFLDNFYSNLFSPYYEYIEHIFPTSISEPPPKIKKKKRESKREKLLDKEREEAKELFGEVVEIIFSRLFDFKNIDDVYKILESFKKDVNSLAQDLFRVIKEGRIIEDAKADEFTRLVKKKLINIEDLAKSIGKLFAEKLEKFIFEKNQEGGAVLNLNNLTLEQAKSLLSLMKKLSNEFINLRKIKNQLAKLVGGEIESQIIEES